MSKKKKEIRLDALKPAEEGIVVERRSSAPDVRREKKTHRRDYVGYTRKMRKLAASYGNTVFFVNGRNGARVLGALSKICSIKQVSLSKDGVRFEAPSKHRKQIIALLDNLCYDYKIIKNTGSLPFAINTFARFGFAIGIIAVLVCVGLYPQFITKVSIGAADGAYGDAPDAALNARIQDILTSYGVQTGRFMPKVDCGGIEKSLLALDGVSYASVQRNGTHINVLVKRELKPDYIVDIAGSKVTARRVAVVTRVIVEGGTAVVKYGDVVRAGDTLIDGYVEFGEDKLPVEAQGVVYGKAYYKQTRFFADKTVERKITNVKRVTKLSMFGKIPKTPSSPFEKYETATSVEDLGFLLPFKIYKYEFREIAEVERENDLTLEEMYDSVYSEIAAQFTEPLKVLDRYCSCVEANGGKYVTVTVETEEVIS